MKVKKYLPSLITLANLFLGFLSILYIQRGYFEFACNLILIAAILDSFDGKLARKIGIASDFGKEIDSLADLISFCLAPSVLIFNIFYSQDLVIAESLFLYLATISSLPVLMGAIRLARFNVGHPKESKQNYFVGLPSPMAAISVCSIVLLQLKLSSDSRISWFFGQDNFNVANGNGSISSLQEFNIIEFNIILSIIILLSFLMISKIQFSKFPLFSLNYSKENSIRLILLIIIIILLIISKPYGYFHIGLFLFSAYYIISNILFHFINNSIKLNELRKSLKNKKRNL